MSRSLSMCTVTCLGLVLASGCEVPEELAVSLYEQGNALHGGPDAQHAAQGVINGIELREVRHEHLDLDTLGIDTRCRLGIFLGGSTGAPDGFVTVDGAGLDQQVCDDLAATESRKAAGRLWTQRALPYPSDNAAQTAQAEYASEYARQTRKLGIEADEWSVPNELDECITERIKELGSHQANVALLKCQGYRDPNALDVDKQRVRVLDARIRAEQQLADSIRKAPEVPASFWGVDGVNGRKYKDVSSLESPYRTTLLVDGTVGFPVTLVRGETFEANLFKEEGFVHLSLWSAEGGNKVAEDEPRFEWVNQAAVSWTPARSETYVLVVTVYDGPRSIQLEMKSDGAGTLTAERRQELDQFVKRAGELTTTDQAGLIDMLRWENVAAHQACVDAALFEINSYARHQAVKPALTECSEELEHRIETRERVLELSTQEEEDDDD